MATTGLTNHETGAWKAFLSANLRLLDRLDHDLQERSHLSLTDFEILNCLHRSENQRIRMSQLAEDVLVSRSRLTYRIDRLAKIGYVTREACEDDGRGTYAILTADGRTALNRATPGHHDDLRTWFLDVVTGDELDTLNQMLSRVDAKLTAD